MVGLLVAGAAGLALLGIYGSAVDADDAPVIRTLFNFNDGWRATQLCSRAALADVGSMLDLHFLPTLDAATDTGSLIVVAFVQVNGPTDNHFVAVFENQAGVHKLHGCYASRMRRVTGQENGNRIATVMRLLDADYKRTAWGPSISALAALKVDDIIDRAQSIDDASMRWDYLRMQLQIAPPDVAAEYATDPTMLELQRETTAIAHPELYEQVMQRRARRHRHAAPAEPVQRILPVGPPTAVRSLPQYEPAVDYVPSATPIPLER